MRLLLILILWQISLISYAAEKQRGRASGAELAMLPEFCQVRFQYGLNGKEFSKWKQILGKDYVHIHHYCEGLTYINRAAKRDEYRRSYLDAAQSQLKYNIVHLINPNYVLLPDIYYHMGVVMKKKGEFDKAISYANQSIQAKKQYLKPYLLLADIYLKTDNKEQAEEILLEAKKYHPKSRAIKRRLKKVK